MQGREDGERPLGRGIACRKAPHVSGELHSQLSLGRPGGAELGRVSRVRLRVLVLLAVGSHEEVLGRSRSEEEGQEGGPL